MPDRSVRGVGGDPTPPLSARKVWVPQMSWGGATVFAAAFRSVGIDADVCPESDDRTLELAASHTSGEECLPARVTLGNFLKVIEQPQFAQERTAFFMPTADGPCRFGQYAPYIQKVLRDLNLHDVEVLAPSSRDGYKGLGGQTNQLMRTALRGLVCADILRKMLHRVRPYEASKGDADAVHRNAITAIAAVLERRHVPLEVRMQQLEVALRNARAAFGRVPARFSRGRLLIGVVGEIFCRLTPFTNESIIRRIEDLGGECTLAPLVEWVWYTNREHQNRLRRQRRTFSTAMVTAKLSDHLQHKDEHRLYQVFAAEFLGYEEPPVHEILGYSEPYLPAIGALGEMTLSVGKAVFHHHQGCDGVVDVAPFTCMNGIVTEAIYPRVSADHDDMPIRNLFFDGPRPEVERDLGVFMELARAYRARKKVQRTYPPGFPEPVSMEP